METAHRTVGSGTYVLASWLFLRLLGLIYLSAFLSLAWQIRGLVGRDGILPAAGLFVGRRQWGTARFLRWPTLFWIDSSDRALLLVSWGGAGLALLLIMGVCSIPVLVLLWTFYLSLFTVCRLFLCYQWDILLLETGFLACFLAPPDPWPHFPPRNSPSMLTVWLFWWLLFRLMFWSGAVKLRHGDSNWRKLTALKYHFETQPLPTPLAWYAHQLPLAFHRSAVAVVFVIELVTPFLIFLPPPWRYGASVSFIGLMILVQLTGNYAFFNLLGIALSLLLLDDRVWLRVFQRVLSGPQLLVEPPSYLANGFALVILLLVGVLSIDSIVRLVSLQITWPPALGRFFDLTEPFHLVNSYGLFAVMTTWRPEIIVEGSHDGRHWEAYEFKCKPGAIERAPRWVAPHQPRLDWQMWFAALGAQVSHTWFDSFCDRLIRGSPVVLALLKRNPFPGVPPRFIRGVLYAYRFTNTIERRNGGGWWCRQRRGFYRS